MTPKGHEPIEPVTFSVRLRRACLARGLVVSPASAIDIVVAARSFAQLRPQDLYLAARAICVHRPQEFPAFDEAFSEALSPTPFVMDNDVVDEISEATGDLDATAADEGSEDPDARALAYSRKEQLSDRDIADCDDQELAAVSAMLDQLMTIKALRRRRRSQSTDRRTQIVDIRRAVARSHATQGEVIELAFRRRSEERRPAVFLLDVSGSMEPYVATLLRVIHGVAHSGIPTEAFSLGTRLTRLTKALSTHDPDAFSTEVASMVRDLAGGTRLGEALESFNSEFGIRGMARAATVVIFSDGLDRGDPELLGNQMERLHRVAHRVIWVNPLKGTEGYAPLARGMRAALPAIDHFVSGHSVRALMELVQLLRDDAPRQTSLSVGNQRGFEAG